VLQGTRGSSPAPGADFVRVGGNTSCVAVTPGSAEAPTLLLDAGTGLSNVTSALGGAPYRGDILLTHLHWDHVQGLPFFAAGDRDDAEVRLLLPAQAGASPGVAGSAESLLAGSMSPPHFPIGPDGLRGSWSFHAIDAGRFSAGGCMVTAAEVPHKGGRTFGYRVEMDGASLAYLPDHQVNSDPTAALRLADGVDVLCHGAMFTEAERSLADGYGHSTLADARRIAEEAGVGRLVLVHHSPARTDDAVETMARQLGDDSCDVEVSAGCEGDVVLA